MDWDRFKFEYHIEYNDLRADLVSIEAYKEAALNLVLPPDWRQKLDRLNRIRAVHGTTALEGNPLSEEEVGIQIDLIDRSSEERPDRLTKEQTQIRNAGLAQDWVKRRFVDDPAPIRVHDLLQMHQMITEGSDETNNVPGRFREFSVVVGSPDFGGVHRGAPYRRVPELMDDYIRFIGSRRFNAEHPVIRALVAHFFLVTIHPFGDGNGRISRLVEAGLLFRNGYNVHGFYGLSNFFYRNQDEYRMVLQACRRRIPFEMDPFIRFGVRGFAAELKGINNFIKTKLNRVVYRTMLVRASKTRVGPRRRLLNDREYQLLDYLVEITEPMDPFSDVSSREIDLSDLWESRYIQQAYRNVTTRTLVRELSRLGSLGFIRFMKREESRGWSLELDFAAIGRY